MAGTFDSTKDELEELLKQAKSGDIQLPDFQRGWVWDDEHIRDLIASVSLSFPIGAVMMLETGGEVSFKTRPLEGVALVDEKSPDELVLDGQQRLTSLYQALASGQPVLTRDTKKVAIRRWYYLDIKAALTEGTERIDAILSVPEDKMRRTNFGRDIELDLSAPELEYEHWCFPLSQVFDHHDWASGFRAHHDHNPEVSKAFDRFDIEILKPFRGYQLPVIRLGKKTPKEAVCMVFEKVNTGGVSLTVFELLTATFAAVAPPDFELRTDWEQRRKRLHEHKVLREVSSTDFLQAITLLATRNRRLAAAEAGTDQDRLPAVSCKRRDMLRLSFDEYIGLAPEVEEGFLAAARFVHREHVFETRFLPYGTQLIPLAALLAVLGKAAEPESVHAKLVRWYWCGVFGELYGSATETRFARDLGEILTWIDGGPEPRTIDDANFAPERLMTLRTRGSAAYKGLYVLLLREGARDFRTGESSTDQAYFDEQIDIHHVFPQKWCGDQQPPIEPNVFNSILNKTPLTARTNRIIGGSAPSKYLTKLAADHGLIDDQVDANLRSHFIDPELLRSDDFDGFLAARRDVLLAKVAAAMGKQLVAVPEEAAEPVEDDEYADDAA